jgi:hypothetical protein
LTSKILMEHQTKTENDVAGDAEQLDFQGM